MSSLRCHPDWDSTITITGAPTNLSSNILKIGKNPENPLKIPYNPKIKLSKFLINRFYIRLGCFGQFKTFRTQNGHVFHIVHAAKVSITGISPAKNEKYWYFLSYPL